mgnify:CR=1 FL=1
MGLPGLAPGTEAVIGLCILAAIAWLRNFIATHVSLRALIARSLPPDGPSPRTVAAPLARSPLHT